MPTYTYRCPHGHDIEEMRRMSQDHHAPARCAEHACEAVYVFRPTVPLAAAGVSYVKELPNWSPEERAQRQAAPPMATFTYRCAACDHDFIEINDFTAQENPETPRPCPKCGVPAPMSLTMSHVDGTMRMYPYFDRGLDCMVESAQHRRAICKERGLVAVEGDVDISRMHADATRDTRMKDQAYRKMLKERWDDNDMRAWRDQYKQNYGEDFIPPS